MSALEAIQTVQFVTVKDKRFAVIDAKEWEALIDWLETLEDMQTFKESYEALEQTGGDRQRAGWRQWSDVRDEID